MYSSSSAPHAWVCSHCTFENSQSCSECCTCGNKRMTTWECPRCHNINPFNSTCLKCSIRSTLPRPNTFVLPLDHTMAILQNMAPSYAAFASSMQLNRPINISQNIPPRKMESSDGEQQCSICQEEIEVGESIKILPCKHHFHTDCIDHWLSMHADCPVCRKNVNESI